MQWIQLTLQVLVLAAIAAAFVFRRSLVSYVDKKGENLATKEDIEDITRKIERTKSQYSAEVERLKAELQVLLSDKVAVRTKADDALLAFFDGLIRLSYEKLATNPGDVIYDGGKGLAELETSTIGLLTKVYVDYHRLLVFVGAGDPVTAAAGEVVRAVAPLRKAYIAHFGKLKLAFIDEMEAIPKGEAAFRVAVAKTNEVNTVYRSVMDPLEREFGVPPVRWTPIVVGVV